MYCLLSTTIHLYINEEITSREMSQLYLEAGVTAKTNKSLDFIKVQALAETSNPPAPQQHQQGEKKPMSSAVCKVFTFKIFFITSRIVSSSAKASVCKACQCHKALCQCFRSAHHSQIKLQQVNSITSLQRHPRHFCIWSSSPTSHIVVLSQHSSCPWKGISNFFTLSKLLQQLMYTAQRPLPEAERRTQKRFCPCTYPISGKTRKQMRDARYSSAQGAWEDTSVQGRKHKQAKAFHETAACKATQLFQERESLTPGKRSSPFSFRKEWIPPT